MCTRPMLLNLVAVNGGVDGIVVVATDVSQTESQLASQTLIELHTYTLCPIR